MSHDGRLERRHSPAAREAPSFYGIAVIAVFVSVFGVWGIAAPISGAVVSTGYFVASGQNKIMQHLEGGVIAGILVSEGDLVRKGQEIITLDQTAAAAEFAPARSARGAPRGHRGAAGCRDRRCDTHQLLPSTARRSASGSGYRRDHRGADGDLRGPPAACGKRDIHALCRHRRAQRAHQWVPRRSARRSSGRSPSLPKSWKARRKLLSDGFVRRPEVLALRRAQAGLDGEVGAAGG